VVRALEGAQERGLEDLQVRVLHSIGADKAKGDEA
jgi:hypothetical protein